MCVVHLLDLLAYSPIEQQQRLKFAMVLYIFNGIPNADEHSITRIQ